MKCNSHLLPLLIAIALGGLIVERPAAAQYRTTASRVRALESRFDELIQLNESFLPTIERMNARLDAVEHRIENIGPADQRYAAKSDIAELKQRLEQLERQLTNGRPRTTSTPDDLAWLRSEHDILAARVNGFEGRVQELAQRTSRPREREFRQRTRSTPVSFKTDSKEFHPSAFPIHDRPREIRVTIEVHVTIDSNGSTQVYRTVR